MRATPILSALCAALALSACLPVNPITMARLATLSPFEANPADLAVIAELPDWAYVAPGSARFVIYSKRSDTGQALNEEFTLTATPTPSGGERFAIAPHDLDRVRTTQRTVARWEEDAPRANSGGFSAFVRACTKPGQTPNPDDTYSLFIAVEQDTAPMALIRNAPVKTLLAHLDPEESGGNTATPCN